MEGQEVKGLLTELVAQAELAVLKTYEYVLYHDGHRGPRVHAVHKKLEVFPAETWQCWLHKVISETLQPLLEQRAELRMRRRRHPRAPRAC